MNLTNSISLIFLINGEKRAMLQLSAAGFRATPQGPRQPNIAERQAANNNSINNSSSSSSNNKNNHDSLCMGLQLRPLLSCCQSQSKLN
mmetsp:Transcript_6362/g.14702  ORF Transcript_6362/g.14702 Transcript_6362/m.14702 type:complete len:89 (-) Transcript_6362:108-374(-)